MERVEERFLRYIKVHTASCEDNAGMQPSSECQWDLARMLEKEMRSMGLCAVGVDAHGYVYGRLPATEGCEKAPVLGFLAHMDTSPDFAGRGVCPQEIQNYDGTDVTLGNSGRVLRVADFPHLATWRGRTLYTTDGTTLLGADDKAGIAEILTAVAELQASGVPHGELSICFTPDEEIGAGVDNIDLARLGCDYAYTLDGELEGEIVYENFNAAGVEVRFRGVNVHPGSAKDLMVNAQLLAIEFHHALPAFEAPQYTDGYEGFFHLVRMQGTTEAAELQYIVRDHSAERFAARLATLRQVTAAMQARYGAGAVQLTIEEQYRNMREKILPHMHLVDTAKEAIRAAGLTVLEQPIRGGTDGARLSFMGVPCPNLGTGGYAFHGPFEHISREGMEASVRVLLGIVTRYASRTDLQQ